MAEDLDYYAALELAPDADEATIRLAYRRLARLYHPDVAGTGDLTRMQQLNAAYRVLSDPERRREYDFSRGLPLTPDASNATEASTERPRATRDAAPPRRDQRAGSLSSSQGPLRRVATLQTRDDTPVAALDFATAGALVGVGLIDGRVTLWDAPASRLLSTLAFAGQSSAGVLQELRLSPGGAYAIGWGFQLGTRVWRIADGQGIWSTGINGPSGTMDAALFDAPPFVRLAVPDAPLAVAEDDPFRWAHEGRKGSAVFSRPLAGPVNPAWAIPKRCPESAGGGLFTDPPDERWRVHQRVLSADGRGLFTCSTGRTSRLASARVLHVWDLEHRGMLGAAQPRRIAQIARPVEEIGFPLAVTPDLAWTAATTMGRDVRLLSLRHDEQRVVHCDRVPDAARIALSADGAYLALARESQLDLWETRGGRHLERWQFASEITALDFAHQSPHALLGIGLRNGIVELWA